MMDVNVPRPKLAIRTLEVQAADGTGGAVVLNALLARRGITLVPVDYHSLLCAFKVLNTFDFVREDRRIALGDYVKTQT